MCFVVNFLKPKVKLVALQLKGSLWFAVDGNNAHTWSQEAVFPGKTLTSAGVQCWSVRSRSFPVNLFPKSFREIVISRVKLNLWLQNYIESCTIDRYDSYSLCSHCDFFCYCGWNLTETVAFNLHFSDSSILQWHHLLCSQNVDKLQQVNISALWTHFILTKKHSKIVKCKICSAELVGGS